MRLYVFEGVRVKLYANYIPNDFFQNNYTLKNFLSFRSIQMKKRTILTKRHSKI